MLTTANGAGPPGSCTLPYWAGVRVVVGTSTDADRTRANPACAAAVMND